MNLRCLTVSLILFLVFVSCKKNEGLGGRATIKGDVFAYDINAAGMLQDSGWIQDQDVFLSFGSNSSLDLRARTNEKGEYEFRGLQKGNYTLRIFHYCYNCPLEQASKLIPVVVKDAKEKVLVPTTKIFIK